MDKIVSLLRMLEGVKGAAAGEARRLLSMPDAILLLDEPANPTVHNALRLWRVRSRIGASRGNPLPGAEALIEALCELRPLNRKLDQYAFNAGELGGSVFFNHSDGRFVGYVLGSRKVLRSSGNAVAQEAVVA